MAIGVPIVGTTLLGKDKVMLFVTALPICAEPLYVVTRTVNVPLVVFGIFDARLSGGVKEADVVAVDAAIV